MMRVSEIAALLDSLHDTHTFLVLPPRTHVHDYGFQMEMIGDRCYVVRVRAGSDAEKKGLRQGDEILDLRGNPGGYVDTLDRLLGGLFQNDLKICDRVGRDGTKSMSAMGRHHDAFTGRFAVLIDSESASASEVLARVVQIERRGFIVGDRSSGSVMEARHYPHEVSIDSRVSYAPSVTDADLVMTDGKTLEPVGVEPDIVVFAD